MILNNSQNGFAIFFSDRSRFAKKADENYSVILKTAADALLDGCTKYSLEVVKAVSAIVKSQKYVESDDLKLLSAQMIAPYSRFTTFFLDPRVKLWRGLTLDTYDVRTLASTTLTVGEKELLSSALTEIVVNESLASGLILSEDEINDSNGDTEPETPAPVVTESFHYAQSPLRYADVDVGAGNFATLKGYTDCSLDSVSLCNLTPYALPVPASIITAWKMAAPNYTWGATTARLQGFKLDNILTPSAATVSAKTASNFDFSCSLLNAEARKILVEFSGDAKSKLISASHIMHSGGIGGFFATPVALNGFRWRWLADNLMEVEIDQGFAISAQFDLPANVLDGLVPTSSYASYMKMIMYCTQANIPYGMDASYRPTFSCPVGSLRLSRTIQNTATTGTGTFAQATAANSYPIALDSIGLASGMANGNGVQIGGLTIAPASFPTAIAAKKSTVKDAAFRLSFVSDVTLVSVKALKSVLSAPATISGVV